MINKTVAGIIFQKENKNKILLQKRNTKNFKGFWGLPGGKVEPAELKNPKKAVKREIKEETNLDFYPNYFKEYYEDFPKINWQAKVKAYYGFAKKMEKLSKNEESSDLKWFPADKINKMRLAFGHKKIIKDFLKFIKNNKQDRYS